MRYLVKRGSRLNLLAFASRIQPSFEDYSPPDSDFNGHWWPNYYCSPGHEIDIEGREHTVAILMEYPSLQIPKSSMIRVVAA
jgi:hypothetical protein